MEEKKMYIVSDGDLDYYLYLTKEQTKVLDFIKDIFCWSDMSYCAIEDVDIVEGFEK